MEAYEHTELAGEILLSSACSLIARAQAMTDPTLRALLDTLVAFDIDEGLFLRAYAKRVEQLEKGCGE